jgi:plasmid maintenance system antidote protein VapI
MTNNTPAEGYSPGEYLDDELVVRGWTLAGFAERIGLPASVIKEIINGDREITSDIALAFSAGFGTSARFLAQSSSVSHRKKAAKSSVWWVGGKPYDTVG